MINMLKLITIITLFFIYSCSNTSPTIVQNTDAQKVTAVEYGTIKTSLPVKIKGESDYLIMCERNKKLDKLIGHSLLITELEMMIEPLPILTEGSIIESFDIILSNLKSL